MTDKIRGNGYTFFMYEGELAVITGRDEEDLQVTALYDYEALQKENEKLRENLDKLQESIFILTQSNALLLKAAKRLVSLESKDGGRSFPGIKDIEVAREAIQFYNEMKEAQKE